MKKKDEVILFISRESATYDYTRRQVEHACNDVFGDGAGPKVRTIEVEEDPELAERYNVEALPTLIVGEKRFVGTPTQEILANCMGLAPDR